MTEEVKIEENEKGQIFKVPMIFEALAKAKSELGAIGKGQKATGFGNGYNFRGIDDIYNALHHPFSKNGISCTSQIIRSNEEKVVSNKGAKGIRAVRDYRFKFYAQDGSYIETEATGEAIDYGDKVYNKCHSIAHKYAIITTMCIPVKEMEDPDKTIHEPVKEKKPQEKEAKSAPKARKNHAPKPKLEVTSDFGKLWNIVKGRVGDQKQSQDLLGTMMQNKFGHMDPKLLGENDVKVLSKEVNDLLADV